MSTCTYRLKDASGKEVVITGQAEMKAFLADGGIEQLLPGKVLPWKDGKKASIKDFGEKIGGARKDVWTSFKDDLDGVPDDEITSQPLSKIWPSPDYQSLIDGGMDPEAAALVRSLRDEIPVKPRKAWKLKAWVEQVKALRDMALQIVDGRLHANKVRAEIEGNGSRFLGIIGRSELYQAVGHEKTLEGIRLLHHHYSLYRGRENVSIWVVERDAAATAFSSWPQELATGDTKEEAIAAFKEKYASITAKKSERKASFDIVSNRGSAGYWVAKKVGRNHVMLAGPFDTVKEARTYRDNNEDELTGKLEKYKEVPSERRDTNDPRVGEDMRGGQDVTPKMFSDAFGFKGVEFGNWVEQSRRQKDLNDAFDALMDMAAVLGIPPKAISLDGKLGLAFGARGSGGVNAASAHYEPGKVVINLTKRAGAGSLGHEWWHAVDNYFAKMRKSGDYMTTALDVSLASRGSGFTPYEGVRKEVVDAFGAVVRSIGMTGMKKRSRNLDKKRTKEYWTTGEELSARAFEAYLISKLQDQNASNDYLANIVSKDAWDAAAALGIDNDDSYPYPTAEEIPSIRAGFDQLFQTIQTKET
ncbi:MAG: LPD5 domain-containing protein, partial [Afipia sp.]